MNSRRPPTPRTTMKNCFKNPRRLPISTAAMVDFAIIALNDKGSSLQAIKIYIGKNYMVDIVKRYIFIKKYLKSAVQKKIIIQARGTGASGLFKMAKKIGVKKTVRNQALKNHSNSALRQKTGQADKPNNQGHQNCRRPVARTFRPAAQ